MYDNLTQEEILERLTARDKEVLFLKDELLKAAHQIERFAERMEEQNTVSSKLLKLLSPTKLPNIPGFELSSKFVASLKGSEYMEVLNYLEKNRFGILMSHAEGPGLSALFLASLLKFSPQIDSSRKWEPKVFVENLAKELIQSFEEGHKASILYGYFDRSTNNLKYTAFGDFGFIVRDTKGEMRIVSPHHKQIDKTNELWNVQDELPIELEETLLVLSPGYLKAFLGETPISAMNKIIPELEKREWSDLNQIRNELFVIQKQYSGENRPVYDASVIVLQNQDRSLKLASPET